MRTGPAWFQLHHPPGPASWTGGMLSLAVTALLAAAVLALVTYGGRWLSARRLVTETESYLREQAEKVA